MLLIQIRLVFFFKFLKLQISTPYLYYKSHAVKPIIIIISCLATCLVNLTCFFGQHKLSKLHLTWGETGHLSLYWAANPVLMK